MPASLLHAMRPIRRSLGAAFVVAATVAAGPAAAQLTSFQTFEGAYDYVAGAQTLRTNSNPGNACSVAGTATNTSVVISGIPAGATVFKAYLYWGGSGGTVDNSVIFNNTTYAADRTFTNTFAYNGNTLRYFGGEKDVTAAVTGNGTFTLRGLSVTSADQTGAQYCSLQTVFGGWGLLVVYNATGATQPRRISVYDGLFPVRQTSQTITLSNFLAPAAPAGRISAFVFEGDPDQTGDATNTEGFSFNGTYLTDATNPSNNTYNSTVNGAANVYGVDLDAFDVASQIAARSRTATVTFSSGTDLVLPEFIVTSIAVSLVDVTPDGPAAFVRLPGVYSQVFAVENPSLSGDNFDLLARSADTSVVRVDSVKGTGLASPAPRDSGRVLLNANTTTNYTVWYTVKTGTVNTQNVFLTARAVSRPTLAKDSGWVPVQRVRPTLGLAKSVSPGSTQAPGTDLTYTLSVNNTGSFAATGVVVVDSVPPQVAFKVGSPGQALPAGVTSATAYSSNGTTFVYTPVSAGCGAPAGYDACVKKVRWTFTGSLAADPVASLATLTFVARIR
ncbi:MAG: conserved repeat domain [Gemmatimonadetes bacterium]|nr:conserved repeat domain [Gemmatimonadota bacterium]